MSEIAKFIGQRIRNYRTQRGLSQEKLAELSGCHPTYIGQVERGEKNATLESIEKIASALNVPLSQLFEKLDKGVKLQFVIHGNLSKLRNIKGSKASTTGHQNRLGSFAGRKRIFFILPYGEVIRLFCFQFFKHSVNGVFIFLVILSDFHSVDELKQGCVMSWRSC